MNQDNYVVLNISDNTTMRAYTVFPENKNKTYPGLILFQEAGGVNEQIKRVAKRFSEEGYVVIAPELFHRTSDPAFSIDYVDMDLIIPHASAVTDENLKEDIKATWDWLENNPEVQKGNIVCVGFCMGGRVSFLANTIFPFKGAVSYYGGGIYPDLIKRADELHSDMLFFWGGLDQYIPSVQVHEITETLKKHGKKYTSVEFSYADHAFFRDGSDVYNKKAAKQSWAITLSYLDCSLDK